MSYMKLLKPTIAYIQCTSKHKICLNRQAHINQIWAHKKQIRAYEKQIGACKKQIRSHKKQIGTYKKQIRAC